jgi:hypothetical protein
MGVSELKVWLSKQMSVDLELISKFHNMSEREWFMSAIAKMIKEERARVEEGFEHLYVKGLVDDVSFTELLGRVPADKLKAQRKLQLSASSIISPF